MSARNLVSCTGAALVMVSCATSIREGKEDARTDGDVVGGEELFQDQDSLLDETTPEFFPEEPEEIAEIIEDDILSEGDAREGCVENHNRLLLSLYRFRVTIENDSDWMAVAFGAEKSGCISYQVTGGDVGKFNVSCSSTINANLKPEYPVGTYPLSARFEFVVPAVPSTVMEVVSTKGDLGAVTITIENINDPANPSGPLSFVNDRNISGDPTNRVVFNVPEDFLAAGGPVSIEGEALPKPVFPRTVCAFYYPWYGSPDGPAGRWVHWDPANHYASTHEPEIGYYDSGDPEVVTQHMQWALDSGIEVLVVSYWGRGSYEEARMPLIMEKADETGMKITVYMEAAADEADLLDQIRYIADTYGTHPAWFSVDSRMLFFIYGRLIGQFDAGQWASIMGTLSADGYNPFLVGDTISIGGVVLFDGIHTYNPVSLSREEAASAYWFGSVAASFGGGIFVATVVPGYDDTIIRDPGMVVEREGGDLYRWYWDAATEVDADMIVITSWNEWHEGSEIEPSVEFGHQYLDITREKSALFCTDR